MFAATLAVLTLLFGGQSETPHIGGYTPNSQLLRWCKSQKPDEYASCWTFISAVVESTGMTDAKWPEGAIELPRDVYAHNLVPTVAQNIEKLEPEEMSSPAVRSVYQAVVAVHPHRPSALKSSQQTR